MKLKTLAIVIGVIVLLVALKFIFFPAVDTSDNAGAQQQKGGAVVVTAYVVKPQTLANEVYATGTIQANESVQLQPELAGKIVQINFTEGTVVAKGQLLVKINDADLQAGYKKLQLQYALADEKLQRQKQLLAIKGISQEEFDVAQNQANVIKADMDVAAAQLAKTEIRAPFTGLIGLRNVSEGAYVSTATVIASIQQIDPVKIDFSVAEKYSGLVKKNDKVAFSVEGADQKFTALVYAVEPRIDQATRSLMVRAITPNPHGALLPGSFARVQLSLNNIDSALMIPTESIIPDLKGQKIYVIRGGKADFARVTTGFRNDVKIQITNGLHPGDTVVTTGIMQLKPGAAVKVLEVKKD